MVIRLLLLECNVSCVVCKKSVCNGNKNVKKKNKKITESATLFLLALQFLSTSSKNSLSLSAGLTGRILTLLPTRSCAF